MLGAYILVSFSVTDLQLSPWLAIPLTLLMSIPVGILFQFLFVRPLIGQPFLPVVMATIGAALIIQAAIQMYWGVIELPYQTVFPSRVFDVEGVRVSSFDLITIGVAAACVALFALFFKLTKIGLQMRAAAENNEAAILSGINVHRVSLVAWSIGTLLAFVAGVILANQQGTVTFSLTGLALLAFPAVVIGGLESIPGAVVGGLIVGILQALIAGYYDPLAQDALVFAALLLMLLVKPTGLFGQKEIVRV
jgi:branched-chain amino acid transport system permease protein